VLEVSNLSVSYGGVPALQGISIAVAAGELVSVIGANGAGKTTLLKAMSGIVTSDGTVTLDGARIETVPSHLRTRRGLIHVPQGRHVFASMSVEENLIVAESYRAKPDNLEFVYALFPDLKTKRRQPAGTLSGGQQQMVAIGRGIMSDPVVLMLDEPSTGLSPVLVEHIFDAIRRIREARPITIVLVEQRATTALDISDRSYVIEQGRIVLSGISAELRSDDRVRRAYLGL
jgi:branched-chain amino acid transport system ATP-binding protein